MKIAGLTILQFIGAIIVGLILSFVIITLIVPHDEKPTQPIPQPQSVVYSSPWVKTAAEVNDNVTQAFNIAILMILIILATLIIYMVFCVIGVDVR